MLPSLSFLFNRVSEDWELLPKLLTSPVSSFAISSNSLSKLLLTAGFQFTSNNFRGKVSEAYHQCYTPAKTRTPEKTVPQEHRRGQSQCWPAHLSVPMQVEPDLTSAAMYRCTSASWAAVSMHPLLELLCDSARDRDIWVKWHHWPRTSTLQTSFLTQLLARQL